jgi:hypothetical protein
MTDAIKQRLDGGWYRVDLHVHSAASADYAVRDESPLATAAAAAAAGLQLLAMTDHHTIAGYERLRQELALLRRRGQRGQLTSDEQVQLERVQGLGRDLVILPGFEYTTAEQLTVLAIFPPETDAAEIKATLRQLHVPAETEQAGAPQSATALPLSEAAAELAESGALVIVSHVVVQPDGTAAALRRDARLGPALALPADLPVHAYELDQRVSGSAGLSGGRLVLRGSDAHRATAVGETQREAAAVADCSSMLQLAELSFSGLRACLQAADPAKVRLSAAAAAVATDEQTVLSSWPTDGALQQLQRDLAALANGGGGRLLLQIAAADAADVAAQVTAAAAQIEPPPQLQVEPVALPGLLQIAVTGDAAPYLTADGVAWLRRTGRTVPADRTALLALCRSSLAAGLSAPYDSGEAIELPRSGVEIVAAQRRSTGWQYEVRDLRTTAGVTRDRAEGLWAYAIDRHEALRAGAADLRREVRWVGRRGLWRAYRQGARPKYDLVTRDVNGVVEHIFFGVSDWGLSAEWLELVEASEVPPTAHEGDGGDAAVMPAGDAVPTAAVAAAVPEAAAPPVLPTANGSAESADAEVNGWGEQRLRWRGRGALARVVRLPSGQVRFDLLMQEQEHEAARQFLQVPLERLSAAWLRLIRVELPNTGIEVAEFQLTEQHEAAFRFRNMRSGDVSSNFWRLSQIDAGTVREYAARTYLSDRTLNEANVRWLGNIGYLRPMRSQIDLVLIDEHGQRRIFYAARRDELTAEWRDLLRAYGEIDDGEA